MSRSAILLIALCQLAGAVLGQPALQWQTSIGTERMEQGWAVKQTTDGGYVVAGTDQTISPPYMSKAMIVKLDATGAVQWNTSLGGSLAEVAYDITLASDGGYVFVGASNSTDGDLVAVPLHGSFDVWVVKLDPSGAIQWQKRYGGSDEDYAYSIKNTADGGYVVCGWTASNDDDVSGNHGASDVWVIKLDAAGDLQWQRTYGGSAHDRGYAMDVTADGGYVIAAWAGSEDGDVTGNHGGYDLWVVKLNSTGDIEWQNALGGSAAESGNAIHQTADGGYIVAGETGSSDGDADSNHGGDDAWVLELNSAGELEWQHAYGGSNAEVAYGIEATPDGLGYYMAGQTASTDGDLQGVGVHSVVLADFWLLRMDLTGGIIWQKAMGGSNYEAAYDFTVAADGGCVLTGFAISSDGDVTANMGSWDMWVVKTDADDATVGVKERSQDGITLAPNPSQGLVHIHSGHPLQHAQVIVKDALGREVRQETMEGSTHDMDLSEQPSGIYLLTVVADGGTLTQRVALQH